MLLYSQFFKQMIRDKNFNTVIINYCETPLTLIIKN